MNAVLFPGENCDTLQYSKNIQEKESENYGSMAAGVVVALILVAIIVALLFYYRRRVANLKTEIAHVQYIADPQAAPGDDEHILLKLVKEATRPDHCSNHPIDQFAVSRSR
jgi:high-affinity Fe2+/Pb2+ permease